MGNVRGCPASYAAYSGSSLFRNEVNESGSPAQGAAFPSSRDLASPVIGHFNGAETMLESLRGLLGMQSQHLTEAMLEEIAD